MSKDKRHGRSQSTSRSRSRSTSRSKSKDYKCGRSSSRSRSRERRKDHTQLQPPPLSSKDKVESQSKDKRKRRSRSNSRERRKDDRSARSSQKTSGSCASSSKDSKKLQDQKKEKDPVQSSHKEQSFTEVQKQLSSTSKVKKEGKCLRAGIKASTPEISAQSVKEIKKEKRPSLDMFEDYPIIKPIKEEMDAPHLTETKGVDEEPNIDNSIKMALGEIKSETFEITQIKLEPTSPELCHVTTVTSFSPLTDAVKVESQQDENSQPEPGVMPSPEQPNTPGLTVSVKQEVQKHSDSDDDFNVDVMLDNLDLVKSERTDASVKHEKQVEEGKNEGEKILAVAGAKSKTQVKRVTWNIQEPEGPQPEKSASSKSCRSVLFSSTVLFFFYYK